MQVKEYIQALTDDGKLRVEKIGSGNWYWTFLSEERRELEKVLAGLRGEMEKGERGLGELEAKLEEHKQNASGSDEEESQTLLADYEGLKKEVEGLRKEEEGFISGGVGEVERKEEEVEKWKGEVGEWTDNIYSLEEYLGKLAGGDREVVEGVRKECYGAEYVESEGLREL